MPTDFTKVFTKIFSRDLPNKYVVPVNGVDVEMLISDIRDHEKYIDDKRIMTQLEPQISTGSIIDFNGSQWIVIQKETIVPESHQALIMSESNKTIAIQTPQGVKRVPTLTMNAVTNLGIKNSEHFVLSEGRIEIVVPVNDDTKDVKRNTRIIVNDRAYEVTHIDDISIKNLMILTCRETTTKHTDDLEQDVADNNNTYEIIGSRVVSVNSYHTYDIDINVTSWSINNTNAVIESETQNSLTLRFTNGGNVTIIAIDENGVTHSKEITINSTLF